MVALTVEKLVVFMMTTVDENLHSRSTSRIPMCMIEERVVLCTVEVVVHRTSAGVGPGGGGA